MSNPIVKNRLEAFQKQAGRCYYCKSPMWLKDQQGFAIKHGISTKAASRFQCTAEHLVARCDGGNDSKKNIVAACRFCNQTRHLRKSPPNSDNYRNQVQQRLNNGKWHPSSLQHLVSL
jgi:hypothetical protein